MVCYCDVIRYTQEIDSNPVPALTKLLQYTLTEYFGVSSAKAAYMLSDVQVTDFTRSYPKGKDTMERIIKNSYHVCMFTLVCVRVH